MAPQIILLVLIAVGLGINLAEHGKPNEGNHNFVYGFVADLIILALLYWGGFFDVFWK